MASMVEDGRAGVEGRGCLRLVLGKRGEVGDVEGGMDLVDLGGGVGGGGGGGRGRRELVWCHVLGAWL